MTSVHILGGFLGAGKTSLLQHILSTPGASGPGTVVLVNEFGRLGLDGSRLRREGLALYELDNGCVCCSLGNELEDTIARTLATRHPTRILIEASGVADPAGITRVLAGMREPALTRPRVITVVDARSFRRRSARGTLFTAQLAAADLVVLNKADLVPASALEGLVDGLRALCPRRPVVTATYGRVEPAVFWGTTVESTDRDGHGHDAHGQGAHDQDRTPHHHHDHEFSDLALTSSRPIDADAFTRFLAGLPAGVLRAKGQVLTTDGPRWVDLVDGRVDWREAPAGSRDTRVVLIGRGFDREALRAAFTVQFA